MDNCSTLIETATINHQNEQNNIFAATNYSVLVDAKVPTNHENNTIPRDFIGSRSVAQVIENELLHQKGEDSFFVADMGEVIRQQLKWKKLLPRIQPFYGKLNLLRV